MTSRLLLFAVFLCLALAAQQAKWSYPDAPRGPVVDTYHGVKVADPYRWLEDPDSPQTRKWIAAENALFESYLEGMAGREAIADHLRLLYAAPRNPTDGFEEHGGRYFYLRRQAGQNQAVLYWKRSRTAEPEILLDPNKLAADGTAALVTWSVSHGGNMLAYGVAHAGSDWQEVRFRQVDDGHDRPDVLHWIKNSAPTWAAGDAAVYYSRFPEPPAGQVLTTVNRNEQTMLHHVGTNQSADTLIYKRPDHPEWRLSPQVSRDGRYLIIALNEGTRRENMLVYRAEAAGPNHGAEPALQPLIGHFEAEYSFLGNADHRLLFETTDQAPKGRVICLDAGKSGAQPDEVVAEADGVIRDAALAKDQLLLTYEKDVLSTLKSFELNGKLAGIAPLPGKGTAGWTTEIGTHGELYFWFNDFAQPTRLYAWQPGTQTSQPFEKLDMPFDPSRFETRQVFYKSKDGTKVPMFLAGLRGFKASSDTPCLLYAYGGFNISLQPVFSPLYLTWIQHGGIVAQPNLRGGGEYGEAWHQAGMKEHKQNVFDDFESAARWLIANGYTSTPKLAINGASNGGLLIGAALNQHPDLYGAAIADVGVMDMLRFQKFTIGAGWVADFGSSDNAADFPVLRAYSPLHNIHEGGHYPPTLIRTADHDDRVVPGHSFKYAAALQHSQGAPNPVLIRIETKAGHGGGKPVSKQVQDAEEALTFLRKSMKLNW